MEHQITNRKAEAQTQNDKPVDLITQAAPELLTRPQAAPERPQLGANASEKQFPKLTIASSDGNAVEKEHKVTGKDNLWKISEAHLKNQHEGHSPQQIQKMIDQIVALNKDKFPSLEKNPHKINETMTLALPQKEGEKPKEGAKKTDDVPGGIKKIDTGAQIPNLEIIDPSKKGAKTPVETDKSKQPGKESETGKAPIAKPEKPESTQPKEQEHGRKANKEHRDKAEPHADGKEKPAKDHHKHKRHAGDDLKQVGDKVQTVASWYHEGSKTANGERYRPDGLTAASKTLPFGSMVEVHNLDNGKSVVVRINDRGPFVKGRGLDVSRGAARHLDMIDSGTARIEYKVLGRNT